MSYILDALRRAETERSPRSPRIHAFTAGPAQRHTQQTIQPTHQRQATRWKLWLVVVSLLSVLGLALGMGPFQPSNSEAVSQNLAKLQPPHTPLEEIRVAATATPATKPTTTPPPIQPILAQTPPQKLNAVKPIKTPFTASLTAPLTAPHTTPPAARPPPTPNPRAKTTTVPTATDIQSTAQPTTLPGRQPSIAISGSSYSANPEHRMLIANGQVIKEGQALAPGLTLETIGPRMAVFTLHGTRFNINY